MTISTLYTEKQLPEEQVSYGVVDDPSHLTAFAANAGFHHAVRALFVCCATSTTPILAWVRLQEG